MATISAITLLVNDYDEAIYFYINKLGFLLIEDTPLGNEKRWVRVSPNADVSTVLVLAKADSLQQLE